jgi:hypothetical protein
MNQDSLNLIVSNKNNCVSIVASIYSFCAYDMGTVIGISKGYFVIFYI